VRKKVFCYIHLGGDGKKSPTLGIRFLNNVLERAVGKKALWKDTGLSKDIYSQQETQSNESEIRGK